MHSGSGYRAWVQVLQVRVPGCGHTPWFEVVSILHSVYSLVHWLSAPTIQTVPFPQVWGHPATGPALGLEDASFQSCQSGICPPLTTSSPEVRKSPCRPT